MAGWLVGWLFDDDDDELHLHLLQKMIFFFFRFDRKPVNLMCVNINLTW